MSLPPKEVTCKCGHVFTAEIEKTWCKKCARPVYYNEKDQKRHIFENYYMLALMLGLVFTLLYLFIEMASPFIDAIISGG